MFTVTSSIVSKCIKARNWEKSVVKDLSIIQTENKTVSEEIVKYK